MTACEYRPHGDDPARALHDLVTAHDARDSRTTTLMDSGDYQLLLVEAPDVEASELRAAIRWRIKDLIDFHIDDAVVDVFEIPGQGRGRTRMMYVVAARSSVVRARLDRVESAGLALEALDIEELALRNLAALMPQDEQGVALVWFALDYGQVLVTRGGELYLARRIETGSRQLFSAAQQGDPANGDYGEALTALLEQVTLEVQRSLDYYESHFSQAPVRAVVVAPAAPELPFVQPYLHRVLAPEVVNLRLDALFPDASLPAAQDQARCLTAIGAALRLEEVRL